MSRASGIGDIGAIRNRLLEHQAREPAWLACLREHAARSVETTGLPHKKLEAWRFTPIAPLDRLSFAPAPQPSNEPADWLGGVEELIGLPVGARALMVNSVPVVIPRGAGLSGLRERLSDPDVRAHLGQHAPAEHFAALNTALFEDGLVLRVRAGRARIIDIVHVGLPRGRPSVSYPRLLILVAEGARATVIESYLSLLPDTTRLELCAPVTEVVLGANARLEHVRVTESMDQSFHLATLAVHQQEDSVYASRAVTLGGALSRVELHATLAGEGAECSLAGAYHAAGRHVVDHHTRIVHAAPRCTSREDYRGIVGDSGRAVFDGTIAVRPHAQGTHAHQENRNLLLTDRATVNTRPHLEIEADDVMCSHGATIGALDEEQRYYLRCRGIDDEQATAMLTYAFVRSVLDSITCRPVRARLSRAMAARLPHGRRIEEMLP